MTDINDNTKIEQIRFQFQVEKVDTKDLIEEMNTYFCMLNGLVR